MNVSILRQQIKYITDKENCRFAYNKILPINVKEFKTHSNDA